MITNIFSTRKRFKNFFTTLTNTSNKEHETGKPKRSSAKCLFKILITGNLKPFVFEGENMLFTMRKKKKKEEEEEEEEVLWTILLTVLKRRRRNGALLPI